MFLPPGGNNINSKARLLEGVDKSKTDVNPDNLVLDERHRPRKKELSYKNKTPIYARTNRIIGGYAPHSIFLVLK